LPKDEQLCNVGSTIFPDGTKKIYLQPVRETKGFHRWIYCKYCYKNVKPVLSGINQIRCSECGCGLTPDFFHIENLHLWIDGKKDDALANEDKISENEKRRLLQI